MTSSDGSPAVSGPSLALPGRRPQPPAAAVRAQIVRDEAELAALAEPWNALLARTGCDVVFLTFEWASGWWRRFGRPGRLFVVVARAEDRLVGIAPLALAGGPLRRLGFLGGKTADYKDLLVEEQGRAEILAAMLGAIVAEGGWDYLDWNGLREDSPNLPHLAAAAARMGGVRFVEGESDPCSFIPLQGSWDAYWQSLSRNFRKNARRREVLLAEERGAPRYLQAATRADVSSWMGVLVAQHVRRWRVIARYSVLESAALAAFYEDVAQALLASGRLRFWALVVGEDVAALDLGIELAGTYVSYLSTFEEAFARYSVGRLLLLHIVRDAFERGLRRVDLLKGDEAYKAEFQPQLVALRRAAIFREGLRGRVARGWLYVVRPRLMKRLQANATLRRLNGWLLRRGVRRL